MIMAAEYRTIGGRSRAPGVHFEEVTLAKKSGFHSGVPVFVGFVKGDRGTADREWFELTSWDGFEQEIGAGVATGYLDYAVRGFFENGGERCVVMPLPEIAGGDRRAGVLRERFEGAAPFEKNTVLEDIEQVDLVCVPDLMMGEIRKLPNALSHVQRQILDYCGRMRERFAILDAVSLTEGGQYNAKPDQQESVGDILEPQRQALRASASENGALYFPWLYVKPLVGDRNGPCVLVPPCGHVAGVYARTDRAVGIHKAPANESIEGVYDLEARLDDKEQAQLNDVGINCLRSFPGRGIRVWGARTLSAKPNWQYVNVRRLFLTVTRWIEDNFNDLVFEPHNASLWERVRTRLGTYCYELMEQGALQGRTPAEAFFVKCDAETNSSEARAAGQLVVELGLAPVLPAEFVVVRITQTAAGTTVAIPSGT